MSIPARALGEGFCFSEDCDEPDGASLDTGLVDEDDGGAGETASSLKDDSRATFAGLATGSARRGAAARRGRVEGPSLTVCLVVGDANGAGVSVESGACADSFTSRVAVSRSVAARVRRVDGAMVRCARARAAAGTVSGSHHRLRYAQSRTNKQISRQIFVRTSLRNARGLVTTGGF